MTRETAGISTPLDLIHTCPAGVATVSADGKINYVNQTLCEMLGVSHDDLMGTHHREFHREDLRVLFGEDEDITVVDVEGHERTLAHTRLAPKNPGDDSIHYFTDETELLHLRQEVSELQLTDPATGLHTERAIMFILEPQVSLCRRYENPLTVMALAIDFDATQDPDLDKKILKISRLLKDQLRWADMLGRTGKDQMMVILPETNREAAGLLAEKIHGIVDGLDDVKQAQIGMTEWKKQDNAATLLKRANEALQQCSQGDQTNTIML